MGCPKLGPDFSWNFGLNNRTVGKKEVFPPEDPGNTRMPSFGSGLIRGGSNLQRRSIFGLETNFSDARNYFVAGFGSGVREFIEKMVPRDGVEPPTPAFSGLRSTT